MTGSDTAPLSEPKGGSDAARISEVKSWLTSQFESSGKQVPSFDYTHRTVTHLHNLATASQAKSQAATIVANDFRQKASEYRAQGTTVTSPIRFASIYESYTMSVFLMIAARVREILESAGMAQESLPSNVVSSAQVLANVANLLNIRDTELSRFEFFFFFSLSYYYLITDDVELGV